LDDILEVLDVQLPLLASAVSSLADEKGKKRKRAAPAVGRGSRSSKRLKGKKKAAEGEEEEEELLDPYGLDPEEEESVLSDPPSGELEDPFTEKE
jgi:hypothetical protein